MQENVVRKTLISTAYPKIMKTRDKVALLQFLLLQVTRVKVCVICLIILAESNNVEKSIDIDRTIIIFLQNFQYKFHRSFNSTKIMIVNTN